MVRREERAHTRHDFDKDVEYALNPEISKETFKGKVFDISDVGLCLYVFHPLSIGQEITLRSGIDLKGTVKWCHELGENIYRVGLQFLW